ncbi:hypothetical protein GOBAR_DD27804 [Gossypium barbadense]|nr:hypothetical protein GOBAR_DD27804 [Gossypium barbadense]
MRLSCKIQFLGPRFSRFEILIFLILEIAQNSKIGPRFGKYVNGTTLVVDGGLWLSQPRHIAKEGVKKLSRDIEKRSRDKPVGVPTSKL